LVEDGSNRRFPADAPNNLAPTSAKKAFRSGTSNMSPKEMDEIKREWQRIRGDLDRHCHHRG
jgi:hypothetical protein